ncbi:PREDICTED: acyl carrier protein 3, chloroplastic-like [Populus euphratica]|uniref:Acyl carrier protein 3, chloroplastic-like n=1 Tax=Populus euphratica TaxID=75702 RepID=A0AAJ6XHX1_POPEU|nr:PREDICTED: acyl carrier protein 3, chloroplastic-like [Populus euphratica]
MASFLAAPACPLVALPTTTRASFTTVQQKSFSVNGGPLFLGVKHAQNIQFSKAASISSTRWRCFKATISCSAQPETLETVQSTIAKQLSVEVSTVTPETKFADLGADSLDTVFPL